MEKPDTARNINLRNTSNNSGVLDMSLCEEQWLKRTVQFLNWCKNIANNKNFNILTFDSLFSQTLATNANSSVGFRRWAEKNNIFSKPVWLIPVNKEGNHWTLFIFVFGVNHIIYLDSLHGRLPLKFLNSFLLFINIQVSSDYQQINWENWKIYVPRDIPSQDISKGTCGLHLCLWSYITCTGKKLTFCDKNMFNVRCWLLSEMIKASEKVGTTQNKEIDINRNLLLTDANTAPSNTKKTKIKTKIFYNRPENCNNTLEYLSNLSK
jgi:Ulp1 family protease